MQTTPALALSRGSNRDELSQAARPSPPLRFGAGKHDGGQCRGRCASLRMQLRGTCKRLRQGPFGVRAEIVHHQTVGRPSRNIFSQSPAGTIAAWTRYIRLAHAGTGCEPYR